MLVCYGPTFLLSLILIIVVINDKIGCDASSENVDIDGESINGNTLIQIGRRLNKPMLSFIGMAMKNLHRCSGWTQWTECGVKISNHFGIRNRRRECLLNSPKNGNISEVETDLSICEGGGKSKMSCPMTYNLTMNGFCIKLQVTAKNHDDAEAECNEDGGYLINIDSDLKYADVKKLLSSFSALDINIGGRRKSSTSPWTYTYGTNSSYFKWFSSNYPQSDSDKLCLALEDFKWWNLSGKTKYPFLCEIPN